MFFVLTLLSSIVTFQLPEVVEFVWGHDQLALDLLLHSVLEVLGTVFIYRMLVVQKQHIVPMVLTIRKLLTSIVNLLYFHHSISTGQYFGIAFVFAAVSIEILFSIFYPDGQRFKKVEPDDPLSIIWSFCIVAH